MTDHLVLARPCRLRSYDLVSLVPRADCNAELTGSTLAFMMRTFAIGFGDFTNYFNFRWASTFYLFEALTMPPVEVSDLRLAVGIGDGQLII